MAEKHLKGRIDSIVSAVAIAQSDGQVTSAEVFKIAGEIVTAAAHVVDALGDRQGHFEELVSSCEEIFDQYVEPLDIKGVPNWAEGFVDGMVRKSIRPALEALYEIIPS